MADASDQDIEDIARVISNCISTGAWHPSQEEIARSILSSDAFKRMVGRDGALCVLLVALQRRGVPSDVMELLTHGDGRGTVAPGALREAVMDLLNYACTRSVGAEVDTEAPSNKVAQGRDGGGG